MRLADKIIAAAGTENDKLLFGACSSVASKLQQAQRFELSADVTQACRNVQKSRPSSILSAMPMLKLPYPCFWMEFLTKDRNPEAKAERIQTEVPLRIGCLCESYSDKTLRSGALTWVWDHPGTGVNIHPIGASFAWDANIEEETKKVRDTLASRPDTVNKLVTFFAENFGVRINPQDLLSYEKFVDSSPEALVRALKQSDDSYVRRWVDNEKEFSALLEIGKHITVQPSMHCLRMWGFIHELPPAQAAQLKPEIRRWHEDLEGEFPFWQAFVTMLCSHNALETTRDNPVQLNRKRQAHGKLPLQEFIVTKLNLSRHAARYAAATGMSHHEVRQHLVRGHFKVRKTGIFWWNPHLAGKGKPVVRSHYAVGVH